MNIIIVGEICFYKVCILLFFKCGDWNIRYIEIVDWIFFFIDCFVLCVCGDIIRISWVWFGIFDFFFIILVNVFEWIFCVVDNFIFIYSNIVCWWGRRVGRGDGVFVFEFIFCWIDFVWFDVRVFVYWVVVFFGFWILG